MTASVHALPTSQAGESQLLRLDELDPSPFNPRKTLDPAEVAELADSIRAHGIINALLIRSVPIEGEIVAYHIIAGSRRRAAAQLAGLIEAPCIVREMTDDEARELAIVDNLQRKDVPALEEADGYEALRQQLGTAEAIAARVGKPVPYISTRLKLVALGELQRKALDKRVITMDHALLLARLGPEEQDVNLKWCLDVNAGIKTTLAAVIADVTKRHEAEKGGYSGYWQPQSVLNLKHHIEQHAGRALSKAPWDLDDASLQPEAGPCTLCPSNTAHNTSLFADMSIQKATCEDGRCFEAKRERFVQIKLGAAKVDDGSLTKWIYAVKLSYKISEAKPAMEKDGSGPNIARVLRYGQWIDAKPKSCPHVRKGVTVDWEAGQYNLSAKGLPGVTKLVCIVEGCTVHRKGYEKKAAQSSGESPRVSQRQIEAKRKEYIESETPIREAIYDAMIKSDKVTHDALFRMLVVRAVRDGSIDGVAAQRKLKVQDRWDKRPLITAVNQASKADLDDWAFDLLTVPHLAPGQWIDSPAEAKRDREDAWAIAKLFGVNADAIAASFEKSKPAVIPVKKAVAKKPAAKSAPAKKAAAKSTAAKPAKKAAKRAPAKKAAKKAVKKAGAK